jgi:hypothetical protein
MSYYDDASLVLIPSGYKNGKVYSQKPTDGAGDLTFTRASNATRVASNGLIEKVRQNVFTYSTDFSNANWVEPAVVTHGQPDPFGGNNASLVTFDALTTSNINNGSKSITSGVSYTISAWIKGVNLTGFRMLVADNKVINVTSQIVNGSWVRVSLTETATATGNYLQQVARSANTNGESFYIYGAQLEVSDFGPTDLIVTQATPLSVGPVSGLPRLDYLNSSCPRLLLEGQRSNLALFSEQFDNAAWVEVGATIGANTIISPDGTVSADSLIENTSAGLHIAYQGFVSSSGSTYTVSFYVSPVGRTNCYLRADTSAGTIRQRFTLTGDGITYSPNTTITKVQNGFYRCSYTFTETTGASRLIAIEAADGSNINYTGNGQTALYLWGAQLEVGAYATSYIPTLSTSVTRVADAASKTGISSLIGQTEGTLFYEGVYGNEANEVYIFLQNSSATGVDDSIYLQKNAGGTAIDFNVWLASTQVGFITGGTFTKGQTIKIAAAYKANDFVLYVNGVQIGADSTGGVPTCGAFQLASYRGLPTNAEYIANNVKQAILFPTRLSNSDLAALTA